MTRLDRYLGRAILAPFGAALAILFFLLVSVQLLQINEVIFGSAAAPSDVARVGLFFVPHFAMLALPLALLFAIIIGLGRLGEEGELTALFAAGVGPTRLYRVPVALALLLGAASLCASLWLEPWCMRGVRRQLNNVIERNIASGLAPGVFSRELPRVTLFAREVDRPGSWRGVLLDDEREGVPLLAFAKRGSVEVGGDENVTVRLESGELHRLEPEAYSVAHFDRATLQVGLRDQLYAKNRFYDSFSARTVGELRALARQARGEGDVTTWAQASVAADARMLVALTCLAFALCAVPLARLGGAGAYLGAAAVVALHYIAGRTGEALAVTHAVPPTLAASFPFLCTFAVAGLLSIRRRRRDRSL